MTPITDIDEALDRARKAAYQWQELATVALRASDCRFLVFVGAHEGVLEALGGLYVVREVTPLPPLAKEAQHAKPL